MGTERAILSAPWGGATCDWHSLSSVYTFTTLQCIWPPGALKRDKHCPLGVLTSLLQRDFVSLLESFPLGHIGGCLMIPTVSSPPQKSSVTLSINCEKSWTESTWRARTATCNLLFPRPHPVPGTWGCSETFKNPGNIQPLPFLTAGDWIWKLGALMLGALSFQWVALILALKEDL